MSNISTQSKHNMIEIAWLHASEIFGLKFMRYIINGKENSVLSNNQAHVLHFMHVLAHKVDRKEFSELEALLTLTNSDNIKSSVLDNFIKTTGQNKTAIPQGLKGTELQLAQVASKIAPMILLKGTRIVDSQLFIDNNRARKTGYEYIGSLVSYMYTPLSDNPESDYSNDAILSRLYKKANQKKPDDSFRSVFMQVIYKGGSTGSSLQLASLNGRLIHEGARKFAQRKDKSLASFVICCLEALKDFKYIVEHEHFWRQIYVEFSGAELINSWCGYINRRKWKFTKNTQKPNQFSIEIPEKIKYKFNTNLEAQMSQSELGNELSNIELILVSAYLVDRHISLKFENYKSIFTPFSNSSSSSSMRSAEQKKQKKDKNLSKNDLKQMLIFIRQIKKVEKKGNLSIALRRFSAASSRQRRPDDALIDAVIALESLFSTGDKDQLTLRIASSIAYLLFPSNDKKRKEQFVDAKKLYKTRSKLVHGGDVSSIEILESKDKAILLVSNCFKALLHPTNKKLALNKHRANSLVIGLRN